METDQWQNAAWLLPLGTPPEISQIGQGVHGREEVERYQLPNLWCLHFYRYAASVRLGDRQFPIWPGHVGVTPANTPMEYRFGGRSPHLYVHFFVPEGEGPGGPVRILAMQDLGDDFGRLYEQMEHVVHAEPQRARARLWEVLWQLAERAAAAPRAGAPVHAAVRQAMSLIDRHLDENLRVARIAAGVGVSGDYLNRLFQVALGMTVVGYLQDRRIQRAGHLLRNSTLPVKAIAALVGLSDLHQFNKAIHGKLGESPRAVRAAAQRLTPGGTLPAGPG